MQKNLKTSWHCGTLFPFSHQGDLNPGTIFFRLTVEILSQTRAEIWRVGKKKKNTFEY
jgi:hypothetical protein